MLPVSTWLEIYCVWWNLATSQSKGPCQDPLVFRVCCCPCLAPFLFYFEVLCHPLVPLKCPTLMSPTCVSLIPSPLMEKPCLSFFLCQIILSFYVGGPAPFPFVILPVLRMDSCPATSEMVYDFLPLPASLLVWFLTSGLSKCGFIHQNTDFLAFCCASANMAKWQHLERGCEDVETNILPRNLHSWSGCQQAGCVIHNPWTGLSKLNWASFKRFVWHSDTRHEAFQEPEAMSLPFIKHY